MGLFLQEMMDRNKFPSNESFTYDLLSGKEMDQRRRGMVALRDEVSSGLGRMRYQHQISKK
jgi:hypothetical protein